VVKAVLDGGEARFDHRLEFEVGENMQYAGHLAACPDGLRRPVRNGLQVRIELRGVHDGDEIALAATGTVHPIATWLGSLRP
jgi:hypothetical protein